MSNYSDGDELNQIRLRLQDVSADIREIQGRAASEDIDLETVRRLSIETISAIDEILRRREDEFQALAARADESSVENKVS